MYTDNKGVECQFSKFRAMPDSTNQQLLKLVGLLMRYRIEVKVRWCPGVLMHYADNASRTGNVQTTEFGLGTRSGVKLDKTEVYLLRNRDISDAIWVWQGFLDIFLLKVKGYIDCGVTTRTAAIKQEAGTVCYHKLFPGNFHLLKRDDNFCLFFFFY